MSVNKNIPTHSIENVFTVKVEDIGYNNPYDFTKIHRHKYYEILFFVKGGGSQLIDFETVAIKDYSCYIVKPRQIHLVERDINSSGYLIQFDDKSIFPELKEVCKFLSYHYKTTAIFENDKKQIEKVMEYLNAINNISNDDFYSEQKKGHLLALVLYTLQDNYSLNDYSNNYKHSELELFTGLVNENLNTLKVHEYAKKLNISTKKLTELIKFNYGITPLKFIHNALIMEIKRDLAFKTNNIKEVCYNYEFDSLSNFSLFVKKNTGLSPTQLQQTVINKKNIGS